MANDRKVKLIIEVDEKDVTKATADLQKLGMAAESVGPSSKRGFSQMTADGAHVTQIVEGLIRGLETGTRVAIALGKGAFDLAAGWSAAGVKIDKAREITGFAITTLSALEAQTHRSEVSWDQVGESLKIYTKLIGDASNGSKDAVAKMARLGIDPVKAANDLESAYAQVVKRITSLRTPTEQANAAMDAFGEQGYKLLPFLKSFNGDVDGMIARARELGLVLSVDDVNASKEFDRALKDVQDRARAVGITFGRELAEPVKNALDSINGWLGTNKDSIKSWAQTTGAFLSGLIGYWNDLASAVSRAGATEPPKNDVQAFLQRHPVLGVVNPAAAMTWDAIVGRGKREEEIQRAKNGGGNWSSQPDDYRAWKDNKLPFAPPTYFTPDAAKGGKSPRSGSGSPKSPAELSPKAKAIIAGADKLGISPIDLATLMLYETAGTLSTTIKGGKGGNYQGLIQFGPEERRRYGVKPGQSFESQVDSAVNYLRDRGVRPGADLLTLYKAVNGGNVNVSANASDSIDPRTGKRNTIRTHVEKMIRDRRPQAEAMFKGFSADGRSVADDVTRMMEKQSDQVTKQYRDEIVRSSIEVYKKLGLLPDKDLISDFQRLLVEDARKTGGLQPSLEEVAKQFAGLSSPGSIPNIGIQQRDLSMGDQRFADMNEQLGITERQTELDRKRLFFAQDLMILTRDYNLAQDEALENTRIEAAMLERRNLGIEASVRLDQERNGLAREIGDLQIQLANQGKNDALEIEKAHLQDILDLRRRELDAVLQVNRAQLELSQAMEVSNNKIRAGVYQHMAQQKTLNEGIVDGINGTYDAILKRMNEPLDKLNEKSKGLLSFLTEPLKAMAGQRLSGMFTGIVDKIFPGMGSSMEKAKNPVVGELKDHTKLLEQIARNTGGMPVGYRATSGGLPGIFGNFGGGMGPGGTPMFNPTTGGGVPPTGTINENGEYVVNGNQPNQGGGGLGGMLGNIGGLFKNIKGMFGPRKNILTGKMSGMAGTLGGIGDIAGMAGGMIGGKWGNLMSMAGMGLSIGANFGPWGAAIGGAIGGAAGLIMALFGGGDNANKKIKEAALAEYGITIKDKSVINSIKQIGEQYFGKGKVGANARQLVQTDEVKNILRNYAEATGQSGTKIDILSHGDENWSGNQFRGTFSGFGTTGGARFGGFRAGGGSVTAGMSYIVGERRPELFVPSVNGTIMPAVPNVTQSSGNDQQMRVVIGQLEETIHMLASRLESMSPGHVLSIGAQENPEAIREGYESVLERDPRSAQSFYKKTGAWT